LYNTDITPLPYTPDYIAGIINYRGSLVAVVNLRTLFNFPSIKNESEYYLVIVTFNKTMIAILADSIQGGSDCNVDTIMTPNALGQLINTDYILGLDQGSVAILNVEKMMADISLQLANIKTI
jgi:purine-binding chemotaxis protein CheW